MSYETEALATVGKADASVVLSLGGRDGIVKFADADSALAVEVRRERVPGSDPEATPSGVVSFIYFCLLECYGEGIAA